MQYVVRTKGELGGFMYLRKQGTLGAKTHPWTDCQSKAGKYGSASEAKSEWECNGPKHPPREVKAVRLRPRVKHYVLKDRRGFYLCFAPKTEGAWVRITDNPRHAQTFKTRRSAKVEANRLQGMRVVAIVCGCNKEK